MKKIISSVLLTAVLMSTCILSSCQWFSDHGKPKGEYYAVKTLYSYEDVTAALEIVQKKYDVEPVYTIDYSGEDFEVFYYFIEGHSWTTYPIDFETYFSTKSFGTFVTYIFFKDRTCTVHNDIDDHKNMISIYAYEGDEDYEKIREYKGYPFVKLSTENNKIVEIEDRSLLRYSRHSYYDNLYYVYYGETEIMRLSSCCELDDEFFTVFFECLVIAR